VAKLTSFLNLPVPSPNEEPYQDSMDAFFANMDINLFSAVTDRNILMTGGGTITFNFSTETLTWTQPILITNFVTGFFWALQPGSAVIRDGEFLYVTLVRGLEDIRFQIDLLASVKSKLTDVPQKELHLDWVVASRIGNKIYLANGKTIPAEADGFAVVKFSFPDFVNTEFLGEGLVPAPDGFRREFFVRRNPESNLLAVYWDGLRMVPGLDYTLVSPRRVVFASPPAPVPGATLNCDVHEQTVLFQGTYPEASIWSEDVSSILPPDGSVTEFPLQQAHAVGTLRVYLDGLRLKLGDFAVVDATTFSLAVPPAAGMRVLVDYFMDRYGTSDFLPFFVFNEIPLQVAVGVYQTSANFQAGTTQVYLNGQRRYRGWDYTESAANKITFTTPPAPTATVLVDYQKP